MENTTPEETSRLRKLADSLQCITDDDLQLLADVTPSTAEAWRKRGQGPAYIRIGNRVLYPIECIATFMDSRRRERPNTGGVFL